MTRPSYRMVLQLCSENKKVSKIAELLGTTPKTVRRIRSKAEKQGLLPMRWQRYGEEDLRRMLNPRPEARKETLPVDWNVVHDELTRPDAVSSKRNHVTIQFLYDEHCRMAKALGKEPMARTTFYDEYSLWCQKNSFVSHVQRTPAMRMEIDYAGDALLYYDPNTAEAIPCYLFVAVLSYSKMAYVEAVPDLGKKGFLQAVINACGFFGGTARLWVPDCVKNAVLKGSAKEWAVLNSSMAELANYYDVEVYPCAPHAPKQKPGVEGGVKNAYQRIYNRIRNCYFYSLDDMNAAIRCALDEFNGKEFKDKPGWTRRSAFETYEKEKMLPLPPCNYEVRETATATVGKDSYVKSPLDKYYYSVPYQHKKEAVTIAQGERDVIIYSMTGEVYARHERGCHPYERYVTKPEHLESFLSVYHDESPEYFIRQASKAGDSVRKIIELTFETTAYPETVYKNCRSILGLGKRYGHVNLEKACNEALSIYGNTPAARIGYGKLKPLAIEFHEKACRKTEESLLADECRMSDEEFFGSHEL